MYLKIYSEVLDYDGSGELDFEEFVSGMSKFSSSEDREAKLRFAFKIYDIDNDGFISNGELYQVIIMDDSVFLVQHNAN